MINSARKLFSSFWSTTTKSDSLSEALGDNRTRERISDLDPCLRFFSFKGLKAATRNFHSDTVLEEDDFETVYRGWIPDDKQGSGSINVVVKKLNHDSLNGIMESKCKVKFLATLSQCPNLEKMMGYGWNDKSLFLVYEFMHKGRLNNHLYPSIHEPLEWDIRVQILIGAARGLAFLHSPEINVVYRVFKPSNIFLDKSYNAKISNSALARAVDPLFYFPLECRCYIAPEYARTGIVRAKSDVYSFGMVLVEVLTGLRAFDANRPKKQVFLTDWIIPHLCERKKLKNIIDPRMKGAYCFESAAQIAQLAVTCLDLEARRRPTMQQVVESLEKINTLACQKPTQPS